jgi:hypothetical protein
VKADSDKDGYVNGAEIKGIFLKSGLQQQVLAHIWFVYEQLAQVFCVFNNDFNRRSVNVC